MKEVAVFFLMVWVIVAGPQDFQDRQDSIIWKVDAPQYLTST